MMQSAGYSDEDFNQVHSMLVLVQPATISATGDLDFDHPQYLTVIDCPTLSNEGHTTAIPDDYDEQPRVLREVAESKRQSRSKQQYFRPDVPEFAESLRQSCAGVQNSTSLTVPRLPSLQDKAAVSNNTFALTFPSSPSL